jgi:RND family efflux transporter MFP subunit
VVAAETAVVQVKSFPVTLSALGTVDARPGSEAQIAAPAATRVTRIYVGTGDAVRAGEPLVALDESVWAAQSAQAEAAFLAAQQAYERAARLAEEGVGPRKDVETAAADLAGARAAREEARRRQALGVLRSPISGIVTAMNAVLAQPVDVNAPLVEVVDPSGLEVLFHVSPAEAARIAPGAAVRLTSGSDSLAVFVGSGVVRGVNAAVDSTTGSVDVRTAVTAPARTLKVGETVSGRITLAEHPNAVVIPAAAVVPAEEGVEVFVVDAKEVAHARPVTVGSRTEEEVEVLSGLKGGERVVASGAFGVSDGATIEPPGREP